MKSKIASMMQNGSTLAMQYNIHLQV